MHPQTKDNIRITLFEGIHPCAKQVFNDHGYSSVESIKGALIGAELRDSVKNAHIIGVRSRTQVTAEVLAAAPHLMAIGCFCIGTNQVDLKAAGKQGVPVFNAPHSNTRSVAELVIGQTIMLLRGISPKSMAAHRGQWIKSALGSHEVRGKVMGIVGYGHIGSQVSILAEAMGMRVIYYDTQNKLPLGNAEAKTSLEALLANADVVTLHVPADLGTANMITRKRLAQMKQGSFLINASRGTVVDIDALADSLKANHLAGAAVDVFPIEPGTNSEPFSSRLIGLEQVILTPHIGGSTQEAQNNIGKEVANKLVDFSSRGCSDGAVNFPMVNMPPHEDAHRVLHVHHNTPGIMREVNKALADKDINVLGQYLATHDDVGYVVFDIAKGMTDNLLKSLKTVGGTIRTRALY